ncbi:hypothetical protein J0X19_02675 [Hymenobacter sp. BT186]|uniref:Uncharacterized protein n=1 Tax=Hymenobacter telluris TaxID=2816474 RepID=A0A939ESV2_9BACT|nr:hypothetical protein [Hymenobacter telluris]MBO0356838.1 hypothetical protein [Hymenobacter telluris]MBW3372864.1 hypothetical protein [Hymenobacter norwichensis]
MFDSPLLDTAIALITLYLLFSQLTLSLVELPAGFLNTRGNYLYNHLALALGPVAHQAFYAAPAIQALMLPQSQKSLVVRSFVHGWPAYISETLFAQTIIGWVSGLAPAATPPLPSIKQFEAGLALMAPSTFKGLLEMLYLNATATSAAISPTGSLTPEEQSKALQTNLEGWFHDFGERMTGWYKRDNRKYLFMAGLVVALLADVDTVRLSRFLADSNHAEARAELVTAGVAATHGTAPPDIIYNPTDSIKAQQYQQQRQKTWDTLLLAANTELRNTLAAVPKVGLPLGLLRWTDHTIDTVYKAAARDTTTMKTAVTVNGQPTYRRVAARAPAQDSVATYQWAASADDYGMPKYAQRWTLDPITGKVGHPVNWSWLLPIGGWLLTAFAMMLGAPFWFETLIKFINVRNVGIKPAKADEK